jgi:hypothetical protein
VLPFRLVLTTTFHGHLDSVRRSKCSVGRPPTYRMHGGLVSGHKMYLEYAVHKEFNPRARQAYCLLGGVEALPPAADRVIEDAEVRGSCLVLARFFLGDRTIHYTLPPPHIFCSFVSSSQHCPHLTA